MVGTQVVVVVHTWPDCGAGIGHIISAPKATTHERKAHAEGHG
ncbi:MAG: hypothetical protein F4X16_03440 [Caldilineaceae bacterium SB0661_bin_34]|nr:hypothetical protein [Caldilineaceae bacterium SB0661_bin_34]